MADFDDINERNVPGRFYVDGTCIDCNICRETAPNFFTRDEETGLSYVYCQPQTKEDTALCIEAMGSCPIEAIGDDGDTAE